LEVASTGDRELSIDDALPTGANGYVPPSVRRQAAQYVAMDQCAEPAAATQGRLTTTTWSCPDGRSVALALYDGGSHDWPEGNPTTPSAQQVMWHFLAPLRSGA
jgi:poly(3-hydroxybutyrate) depolymerase